MKTVLTLLATVLVLTSLPTAPAHANERLLPAQVGALGAPSQRSIAKQSFREWKLNPKVDKLRSGVPTLAKLAVRSTGVVAAVGSAAISYGSLVLSAWGNTGNLHALSAGAIVVGGGALVGAFKIARGIDRNANTALVGRAMAEGVEVSQAQLQEWTSAGLVKTVVE